MTKRVITSAIGFSIVNCCSRSESVTGWVNELDERKREEGRWEGEGGWERQGGCLKGGKGSRVSGEVYL